MKVLGIDTSLRSTGYGVLSAEGSRLRMVECGAIRNTPALPLTACLKAIHERVAALIAAHAPDVMAIESVIYGKNAGTMLVLGEARGAVLSAAAGRVCRDCAALFHIRKSLRSGSCEKVVKKLFSCKCQS